MYIVSSVFWFYGFWVLCNTSNLPFPLIFKNLLVFLLVVSSALSLSVSFITNSLKLHFDKRCEIGIHFYIFFRSTCPKAIYWIVYLFLHWFEKPPLFYIKFFNASLLECLILRNFPHFGGPSVPFICHFMRHYQLL